MGGSIKTRTAYNMIREAERQGKLGKDTVIVEPTSGNRGIGDGIIPDILKQSIYDEICIVTDEEAISTSKALASEEGIMCGIASGTNVAAREARKTAWSGQNGSHGAPGYGRAVLHNIGDIVNSVSESESKDLTSRYKRDIMHYVNKQRGMEQSGSSSGS